MFGRVTGASLILLTIFWVVTVAAGESDRWFGTWQLDPAQSTRADSSPYKRVTLRIEPTADGLTVIYDMIGLRGGVTHLEWTGKFDGRDYAVQGADTTLTNAYRRVDDSAFTIDVKLEGVSVAAARASVSKDGRTLTVTQTERDTAGREVTRRSVYRKKKNE